MDTALVVFNLFASVCSVASFIISIFFYRLAKRDSAASEARIVEQQANAAEVLSRMKRMVRRLVFEQLRQRYWDALGTQNETFWHMRLQFENYDTLGLMVDGEFNVRIRIKGTTVSPDAESAEQRALEALEDGYVVEVVSADSNAPFSKGEEALCFVQNNKTMIQKVFEHSTGEPHQFAIHGLGGSMFGSGKGFSAIHPRIKDW